MFEEAARIKLRFVTKAGTLCVEDLWDLPLTSNRGRENLDDIAKGLFKKLREDSEVSFVYKDKKSDSIDQLRFDIVKHIIDVRISENEAAAEAKKRADKKQELLALIADKENEALRGKSLDELKAMIDSM